MVTWLTVNNKGTVVCKYWKNISMIKFQNKIYLLNGIYYICIKNKYLQLSQFFDGGAFQPPKHFSNSFATTIHNLSWQGAATT